MSDLDNEELEATKRLNANTENISDEIYSIKEKITTMIIKDQEEFIKQECIKYLKENEIVKIFKISEKELNFIFNLGLDEYIKRGKK